MVWSNPEIWRDHGVLIGCEWDILNKIYKYSATYKSYSYRWLWVGAFPPSHIRHGTGRSQADHGTPIAPWTARYAADVAFETWELAVARDRGRSMDWSSGNVEKTLGSHRFYMIWDRLHQWFPFGVLWILVVVLEYSCQRFFKMLLHVSALYNFFIYFGG